LIVFAAALNSGTSVLPEPICVADFANGASGQIDPTVVTSLTTAIVTLPRLPQDPKAVISAIEELFEEEPALPPLATR
jgi:hypothetical protein